MFFGLCIGSRNGSTNVNPDSNDNVRRQGRRNSMGFREQRRPSDDFPGDAGVEVVDPQGDSNNSQNNSQSTVVPCEICGKIVEFTQYASHALIAHNTEYTEPKRECEKKKDNVMKNDNKGEKHEPFSKQGIEKILESIKNKKEEYANSLKKLENKGKIRLNARHEKAYLKNKETSAKQVIALKEEDKNEILPKRDRLGEFLPERDNVAKDRAIARKARDERNSLEIKKYAKVEGMMMMESSRDSDDGVRDVRIKDS